MKRFSTILASSDLGDTGCKVIDIVNKEQISFIDLLWTFTTVTVSVMTNSILSCISKVELVDGSEVLLSLSGERLYAQHYYDTGIGGDYYMGLTVGNIMRGGLRILFGRKAWDTEYALRPEMHKNLQLKITWDEDAANATVVVNSLEIVAGIDDAPAGGAARGMFVNKDQHTYAMAASAHEYINLPTDRIIRRLFVQFWTDDHAPYGMFSTIKLSKNNDAAIPLELTTAIMAMHNRQKYPRIEHWHTMDAAVTANTIYPEVSQDQEAEFCYDQTAFVTAQSKFGLSTFTGRKWAVAASVDIKKQTAKLSGRCPFCVVPIDFQDWDDMQHLLPLTPSDNLRLDILSSSDADSGDIGTVFVQQVRPY